MPSSFRTVPDDGATEIFFSGPRWRIDPVRVTPSGYTASGLDGDVVLRFYDEVPLSAGVFHPGWHLDYSLALTGCFVGLLTNGSDDALWVFDADGGFRGNSLDVMAPGTLVELALLLRGIIAAFIGRIDLAAPLRGLVRGLSAADAERLGQTLLAATVAIQVGHRFDTEFDKLFGPAPAAEPSAPLPRGLLLENVRRILGSQPLLSAAFTQSELRMPSPFGDRELSATHCIYLQNFCIAYVFETERGSCLLFACGSAVMYPLALWWPDADILLTSSHGLLRQYGWEQAFGLLLRALSEHFDAVAMYLRSPSTGVATMTFISHIGHHLWNELSGLDQAVDGTPLWASRVYVCHAETSEHFGEIEDLFGLPAERVQRVGEPGIFPHQIYARSELLVRSGRWFVTCRLTDRIDAHAHRAEPAFAQKLLELRNNHELVLLVSPRFENRGWCNLASEFIDAVTRLAPCSKGIAVVLDGHNSNRGGSHYRSHMEETGRALLDRELEWGAQIMERLRGIATVLDNFGGPVERSVLVAASCDLFVCPWGAALAKYKWAARAQGIVASSRLTLADRDDRFIYESPAFVENGRPDIWFRPHEVTDCSAGPVAIDASRADFNSEPGLLARKLLDWFDARPLSGRGATHDKVWTHMSGLT